MSKPRSNGGLDPADDDEGEVVKRVQAYLTLSMQQGVPEASQREEWERFFRYYSRALARLVRRRPWTREHGDDDVQEVWLLLITRLPNLNYNANRGGLRDWISAVAQHRLADQDRRRRNRFTKLLSAKTAADLGSRETDPSEAFDRQWTVDLVRASLNEVRSQLAERDYQAFTLKWIEGLSVREVGRRLGMTEAQIWSSHHRTLQRLRPLLLRRLNRGDSIDR